MGITADQLNEAVIASLVIGGKHELPQIITASTYREFAPETAVISSLTRYVIEFDADPQLQIDCSNLLQPQTLIVRGNHLLRHHSIKSLRLQSHKHTHLFLLSIIASFSPPFDPNP